MQNGIVPESSRTRHGSAEFGASVAAHFATTIDIEKESQIYPAMCAWYGALTFAQTSQDRPLVDRLISRFDAQITPEVLKSVEAKQHGDFSMLGSVPLEIYLQTKREP